VRRRLLCLRDRERDRRRAHGRARAGRHARLAHGGLIGNGGFYYLFSADYRGDPGFLRTAAAFQTIGSEAAHRAFVRALALFPDSTPQVDLEVRRAFYGGLPESTRQEVDRAFWKADDEVPAKLAAWIRAHRPQLETALRR
jgi:hypothetical protein